jgi:hypothetical protein
LVNIIRCFDEYYQFDDSGVNCVSDSPSITEDASRTSSNQVEHAIAIFIFRELILPVLQSPSMFELCPLWLLDSRALYEKFQSCFA